MSIVILIATSFVCLLASAYFSGTETGFLSVSRERISHLARAGSSRGKTLQHILKDMGRATTTILIGNNIVNVSYSTATSAAIFALFTDPTVCSMLCLVATGLLLYFGEFVPKLLFAACPLRRTLLTVPVYRVISTALFPLTWIAMRITDALIPRHRPKWKTTASDIMKIVQDRHDGVCLSEFEHTLITHLISLRTNGIPITRESIYAALNRPLTVNAQRDLTTPPMKEPDMKQLAIAIALVMFATDLLAIQGTLVTANEELKGNITWVAEKKHYVVAIKKGKSTVKMQRLPEDVVRLDIPRPPELEKALTLIEKGSASAAVPLLSKVANDYQCLKWDKVALRHLVMAHLAADDPQRAFETCKTVMAGDASAAYTGELAPAFWQVLLKLNKKTLLEQLLAKAIKNGDRPSSAAAQVLRGDLIMEDAKDNKLEIRRALTDGYLRVVLLYQDNPCKDIRREALLRAADCHEKLGRPDLAENYRKQAGNRL